MRADEALRRKARDGTTDVTFAQSARHGKYGVV
jgi:hypothetical protein